MSQIGSVLWLVVGFGTMETANFVRATLTMGMAMNRIVVDEETRNQLDGVSGTVELCTHDGRTLGHFVPLSPPDWDPTDDGCPYTAAELARMRQETGGRSLAEIWKSLGQA